MPRLFFLSSPRLATQACTAMDLFSALLAIEPGLVLTEAREGTEPSIEEEAVSSYACARPCLSSGYGMPGWAEAARKNRYLETEREFLGELRLMAESKRLAAPDLSALSALEGAKRAYDDLFSLNLTRLNDPAFSRRLEAVEDLQFALAAGACARYPSVARYAGHFSRIRALLDDRRAAMAESVLAALGRQGADAVVIVGAAERGRLERAVSKPAAALGYSVENFWKQEPVGPSLYKGSPSV
jgi:hypothetical protein